MSEQNRRDFLKTVGAVSATSTAFAAKSDSRSSGRVIGANDRINVGVIGFGGRGSYVAGQFARFAEKNKDACRISAVSRMRCGPARSGSTTPTCRLRST